IDNGPALVTSSTAYSNMWRDTSRGEIIWSLDRPQGRGAIGDQWLFNAPNLAGGAFHDIGRNLFNLLRSPVGGYRGTVFVGSTSIINPNYETVEDYVNTDVLIINKYPGITGAPLNNDLKIFRTSE